MSTENRQKIRNIKTNPSFQAANIEQLNLSTNIAFYLSLTYQPVIASPHTIYASVGMGMGDIGPSRQQNGFLLANRMFPYVNK
jgi:hypothetical protein